MKLDFTIQTYLPSGNKLFSGPMWQVRHKKQREFKTTFFWAIKEGLQKVGFHYSGYTGYFKGLVRIDLRLFHKNKSAFKDRANIIAAADKLIADTLVDMFILIDDSKEYLKWGEIEQEVGDPVRVEVTLTEV